MWSHKKRRRIRQAGAGGDRPPSAVELDAARELVQLARERAGGVDRPGRAAQGCAAGPAQHEPQIVKKRQRRLSDADEVVLSLYAKGVITDEIFAHFADVYAASVSKETVSRITDRVIEEMQMGGCGR